MVKEKISRSKVYHTLSPYQKILVWLYYAENELKGHNPPLTKLSKLTGLSKPTLRKYIDELEYLGYIKTRMVKISKGKEARGAKWALRIEIADDEAREYAEYLYKICLRSGEKSL